MSPMRTVRRNPRASQRGIALIAALLLLLVVTIMAISMFRSYGTQEKIAGNVREKQRAINAAVSAQQYAEWFLTSSGTPPPTTACSGVVAASAAQICNATLPSFTAVPWTVGTTYTQFTTNSGNGVQSIVAAASATGLGTYAASPMFYITDLGTPVGLSGELYQVDAVGYGGTMNSVAVVESTFIVSSKGSTDPSK